MIVQAKIESKKKPIFVESFLDDIHNNSVVIIESDGIQYMGSVVEINPLKSCKSSGKIVRVATSKDIKRNLSNIKETKYAYKKCVELIKKYKLDMRLLDCSYSFDKKQLLFRYIADERIDFRDLAKELAAIFRTRIELRQIGIRDKSSIVSGIGMCGRVLCCSKFLKNIDTVSINMAKNQNLALNPSKINGCCGRLLCCLNYEDDTYKECRKCLPNVGDVVSTEKGEGKVINVQVLNQKYTVDLGNNETVVVEVEKK